jgi:hypothetical protein
MWRANLKTIQCLKNVPVLMNKTSPSFRLLYNNKSHNQPCLLANQICIRYQSQSATNPPPKEPVKAAPAAPQSQPKQQQQKQAKSGNFKQILGVFVSGVVAYFGISYYLDSKRIDDGSINYSSNNLPGKVKVVKSVCFTYNIAWHFSTKKILAQF